MARMVVMKAELSEKIAVRSSASNDDEEGDWIGKRLWLVGRGEDEQ